MKTQKIQNPKTSRAITVRTWDINPREVLDYFRQGNDVKDLSWKLLNEREAVRDMEREQYGDQSSNNFALSVFENALDWTLGLAVHSFIKMVVQTGKMPKPFQVAASRDGSVFIIGASGKVYTYGSN